MTAQRQERDMSSASSTPHAKALETIKKWVIDAQAAGNLGDCQPGKRKYETLITVPGETKLSTTVSVIAGAHTVSATAFVIRNPDENHAGVHEWLLRRNLKLPGVAFSVTTQGDVYLSGKLPTETLTQDTLDRLLGAIAAEADRSFNTLLALGFRSAMQREWDWRTSRGESVANLEAFRHLLECADVGEAGDKR